MELKEFDKEKTTIELTSQEFRDLVSAVFSVDQEFEILDHVILDVPLERIEHLRDALYKISQTRGEHFRLEQEAAQAK